MLRKKTKIKIEHYIYVIPIVICIAFATFFYQLTLAIAQNSYELRFEQKQQMVDLTASEIDGFTSRQEDWVEEQDFYYEWLMYATSVVDMQNATICILTDNNLIPLAIPDTENDRMFLNPLENSTFLHAVQNNPYGTIVLSYDDKEISFYYRWIPEKHYDVQYLMIVGVVPTPENTLNPKFQYVITMLLIFVLIVNYIMIGTILKKGGGGRREQ